MSRLPELEGEYSELSGELAAWRSMSETAGFELFRKFADGQVKSRDEQIRRKPLASMDEVLSQEYMKGEAAGIELMGLIAEQRIEVIQSELNRLRKEIDDEASRNTDGGTTSGGTAGNDERKPPVDTGNDPFGGR